MPFVQVADVADDMKLVDDTKQKISKLAQPMSVFADKGSVLVTLQGSIGRVAITQYGAFVDRTVLIFDRYNQDIDKTFWAYIIKEKFIDEARKAPGGTIKTITKEALSDFDLMLPCFDEQKKLGAFLVSIDNLITLHQRKPLFFRYIFKTWEQRKWSDTVDISTEMVDPTSGEYDDMPHIAPGNIESFTGRVLDNVKSVKEEQLISGKFRFRPGDVVYGKINPQLGKYFYASVDGLTSADAYVFNGKNGITQTFLFSLLQTQDFFKYSVSVSKRSGMPKINRDELNAYSFLAPGEKEQEQIGNFLLDLDNLITLHRRVPMKR
ncbi:type I restriction enzyme, S subunit [Butyrivibrio fibrisolvens]|uniref:Type I restriction enzyme, S subunit n=2 Tax=Butyrivibrio fibrisolvens TaxID=831 RepID=A0A1H9VGI4_BUTFI|nr:type I restriction enzyme, S subunit [Butyrivibrio fibrisolvens]